MENDERRKPNEEELRKMIEVASGSFLHFSNEIKRLLEPGLRPMQVQAVASEWNDFLEDMPNHIPEDMEDTILSPVAVTLVAMIRTAEQLEELL